MKMLFAAGLFAGPAFLGAAHAQPNMTCEAYVQIEGPENKAKPDTSGDPPEARELTRKMLEYCQANPTASVEDAAKAVDK